MGTNVAKRRPNTNPKGGVPDVFKKLLMYTKSVYSIPKKQ